MSRYLNDTALYFWIRDVLGIFVIYLMAWIFQLYSMIRTRRLGFVYPGQRRRLLYVPFFCLVSIHIATLGAYITTYPSVAGYVLIFIISLFVCWFCGTLMLRQLRCEQDVGDALIAGFIVAMVPMGFAHMIVFAVWFFKHMPWTSQ